MKDNKFEEKKEIKEEETKDDFRNKDSKSGARRNKSGKRNSRNGSDGSRTGSKVPAITDRIQFETLTAPTGRTFNFSRDNKLSSYLYSVPGIVRFTFTPTVGTSYGSTSPFNMSIVALQNKMRAVGKYNRNYDAVDIGMYTLAVTSYSTFVTWLKDIYRANNLVTPSNTYYPHGYLRALMVDSSMHTPNAMLRLRSLINNIVTNALNAMYLPKQFVPIEYYKSYQEGLILERPDLGHQSQAYCFLPYGFYKYDPRNKDNPGSCTFYTLKSLQQLAMVNRGANTTAEYITIEDLEWINGFLHGGLFNDQDVNTISQDIREAFSDAEPISFETIAEDESVILKEMNPDMKISIRNMDIVGNITEGSMKVVQKQELNWYQDNNFLTFLPKLANDANNAKINQAQQIQSTLNKVLFLNGEDEGNFESQFHATRFKALTITLDSKKDWLYDKAIHGATKGGTYIISCGPELINRMDIFWDKFDTVANKHVWNEIAFLSTLYDSEIIVNGDNEAELLSGLLSMYPIPIFWMKYIKETSLADMITNNQNSLVPVGTIDRVSVMSDQIMLDAQRLRTEIVWKMD